MTDEDGVVFVGLNYTKLPMHTRNVVLVADGRCCFMSTSFFSRGWIRFDSGQGNNMVRNAIGESFNPVCFAMQHKCLN